MSDLIPLKGKVAVVTGGAIRIGRALTLALAAAGCHVFIHYWQSSDAAKQTELDAQRYGVEAYTHQADLRDSHATQLLIPTAIQQFGQVDILINNAAIFPDQDQFLVIDEQLWDEIITLNLKTPFILSQHFAKQIQPNQFGKIINILDARVRQSNPNHFVYQLTKKGLWQMTEMLALELAPKIAVNGVALGAMLPPSDKDTTYLTNLVDHQVPLQRAGTPQIAAENVLHLLTQDFLTGTIISVDGGQFL